MPVFESLKAQFRSGECRQILTTENIVSSKSDILVYYHEIENSPMMLILSSEIRRLGQSSDGHRTLKCVPVNVLLWDESCFGDI